MIKSTTLKLYVVLLSLQDKFEILYYHLIQKDPELARFFAIQTHLTTIYDQATTFHHMLHIFQA